VFRARGQLRSSQEGGEPEGGPYADTRSTAAPACEGELPRDLGFRCKKEAVCEKKGSGGSMNSICEDIQVIREETPKGGNALTSS